MIKVAVIYGGMSTEHDISMISGKNVVDNLDKAKYDIYQLIITKDGKWTDKREREIKDVFKLLKEMDVVIPVLHGLYGEDGTVQGMLELAKVPYVGCDVLSSSICMDKVYTKVILEKAKIPQAKYIYIKDGNIYIDENFDEVEIANDETIKIVQEKLGFPVFVKPSNSGSSVGVSKAKDGVELIRALAEALNYDRKVLIEEAVIGKEVECAVLGNDDVKATTVGQILSAEEFYSYSAKYQNQESKVVIPADLPQEKIDEIKRMAIKAFKAVAGSGLARVDFFVQDETNNVILNEINTMPGFTEISMYPKLWETENVKYAELLDKLIDLAMQKHTK